MALLTHKVMLAIEHEGFREGRLLLQDWLATFLERYVLRYEAHPDTILHPAQMCAAVSTVPRWVYGLLRGPLLASHTPLSAHRLSADVRTWLFALYRSLPVDDLCIAVRPSLDAYTDPQTCRQRQLPLTWEAIRRSGCALFLLDAYTHIYIFRRSAEDGAPTGGGASGAAGAGGRQEAAAEAEAGGGAAAAPGFDFPPSKASAIWRTAAGLAAARLRTARIVCCEASAAGGDGSFESYIGEADDPEEADASAPRGQGRFSFRQFLGFLHQRVAGETALEPSDDEAPDRRASSR